MLPKKHDDEDDDDDDDDDDAPCLSDVGSVCHLSFTLDKMDEGICYKKAEKHSLM